MPAAPRITPLEDEYMLVEDPAVGRPFIIEVEEYDGGWFRVVGLSFPRGERLSNTELRAVSITRIEAALNAAAAARKSGR